MGTFAACKLAESLGCHAQVWYGVPANASAALEEAMQDALPDLFEAAPDLMYSLVTMVSPMNLQVGLLPVVLLLIWRLCYLRGCFF